MKYYKLTDGNCQTLGATSWGEGITHKATGKGKNLCSSDVIHVYDHPLKAAMFNCIHVNFSSPVLWECRVKKVVANDRLKAGVKQCTTIKRIPLPQITTNQRVHFAILLALQVYKEETFTKWAKKWLSGKGRARGEAEASRARAETATWEASEAAWAATWAAKAAERAAEAAAWEAEAAAWKAEAAAWAASWAAKVAAWAATWVTQAAETQIDLVSLIKQAIRKELN